MARWKHKMVTIINVRKPYDRSQQNYARHLKHVLVTGNGANLLCGVNKLQLTNTYV
jgi:hypothetical protein